MWDLRESDVLTCTGYFFVYIFFPNYIPLCTRIIYNIGSGYPSICMLEDISY